MTMHPTVYIVDDELEIRQAFRWLFESVHINVETFESAEAYLEYYNANPNSSGCLIVDVRMPVMSGLQLVEQLNLTQSNLTVIMITGYGDIPMAVRAMKAGATDFILKPINDQFLLELTQKCLEINKKNNIEQSDDFHQRFLSLTTREKQVMALVIEGKLNKQIAYELNISISTVEAHRARVMQKMKVKNLAELIKITMQQK